MERYARQFFWWSPLAVLLSLAASASLASSLHGRIASYPAAFVFGDSLSDTGNAFLSGYRRTDQWPYGMTFPGKPAHRYSDGHLLVDLLATHLGLPFLNPYLNSTADFEGGVNYAMAGMTANNVSFLDSLGINPGIMNYTLDVQLSWHLDFKAKVESSTARGHHQPGGCRDPSFYEGLYVLEIGGNDYVYSYSKYSPSFVISTIIPSVIRQIHNAVETLIGSGAKHFLFMSITPLGCLPQVLTQGDGIKDAYGCLKEHNFASYLHGVELREEMARLSMSYPNASFLFMDIYGASNYVLEHKEMFGFTQSLQACCGDGEAYVYNFNPTNRCNIQSASVCTNPNQYMIWDGDHPTNSWNLQIFNQTFITSSFLDNHHEKQ